MPVPPRGRPIPQRAIDGLLAKLPRALARQVVLAARYDVLADRTWDELGSNLKITVRVATGARARGDVHMARLEGMVVRRDAGEPFNLGTELARQNGEGRP